MGDLNQKFFFADVAPSCADHGSQLEAEGTSKGEQEGAMLGHSKGAVCSADAPADEGVLLW